MSSILTNASALTALQSLSMTQQNLATTQSQISTGLKVASAADNASYWSVATSLQSNNGVLSSVSDSLAQSQSILGTATAALNSVITTINSIKSALTQATNPGADIATINTTLASLGKQLTDAVKGASFNGLNLLDGSNSGALAFVAGYNQSASGTGTFNTISLSTQSLSGAGGVTTTSVAPTITDATTIGQLVGLTDNTGSVTTASYGQDKIDKTTDTTGNTFSITSVALDGTSTATTYSFLDANGNATTGAATGSAAAVALGVRVQTTPPGGLLTQGTSDLTNLTTSATTAATQITDINATLRAVTSYASIIGSTSDRMTAAANLNSSLQTNYTTGISALIDANMNTASTRLQALQTQQQLGVQSLSIANQSSQLILKLFQ